MPARRRVGRARADRARKLAQGQFTLSSLLSSREHRVGDLAKQQEDRGVLALCGMVTCWNSEPLCDAENLIYTVSGWLTFKRAIPVYLRHPAFFRGVTLNVPSYEVTRLTPEPDKMRHLRGQAWAGKNLQNVGDSLFFQSDLRKIWREWNP